PASGDDKTSLMISMRNLPGALHQILEPFNTHNIDMTRIESRPNRSGAWNYVFFIDFDGHIDEPRVQPVLKEIAERAADMKVLGSYPKGVL
ncbi:MAG: ACT domain-containing protein, partial [Pseudomonadaceae bacterium]|nr:ACT domain-containing protein [Pseudomonadaceae bacterium]